MSIQELVDMTLETAPTDLVQELDRRAKVVLSGQGWPYGPNIDLTARVHLLNWAENQGLRLSRGRRCLDWLTRGRCSKGWENCHNGSNRRAGWLDHVTCWTRGGRPALLLAQPYAVWGDELQLLASLNANPLLRVTLGHGWYGHGTVAVQVWRRDALGESE